jgi:hypothetical protein
MGVMGLSMFFFLCQVDDFFEPLPKLKKKEARVEVCNHVTLFSAFIHTNTFNHPSYFTR